MKQSYLNCLKKVRDFRKLLKTKKDLKRGKLYFSWLASKTEKIENEKDEGFIYKNIIKYTLKNYNISQYIFDKSNEKIKDIIKKNYTFKKNKYVFNNNNISIEDTKLLSKYIIFKRGNVVWLEFGFKEMTRWARITRMKKVSMLRLNFSGTIGAVSGEDMNSISNKINLEF